MPVCSGPQLPAALRASGWNRRPSRGPWTAATHIGVPISQDLVEDVTELPAEDGAAGKWQTDGIGPESEGPLFVVSAQNDAYRRQGQVQETDTHVESQPLTPQPSRSTPAAGHQELLLSAKGKKKGKVKPSNLTGANGLGQQVVFPRRDSESDGS